MTTVDRPIVTISIDAEEDDWGSYARGDAHTRNIPHLIELQEIFDRHGARPTYFVNHPPLTDPTSLETLRELARRPGVEMGAHCHPWNTPPFSKSESGVTMMSHLSVAENEAKILSVTRRIEDELGRHAVSFRAGRWGYGPTVASAAARIGLSVDSSVSPFMDWSSSDGPDYSDAPFQPYRFHPATPLRPDPTGPMVELPPTIGSFRGNHAAAARRRRRLERSFLQRLRLVGLLDRAGFMTQRWLSPEMLDGADMIRLADATVRSGHAFLGLTFHSSALLAGATPFVSDESERHAFLEAIESFLDHCASRGYRFATIGERGSELLGREGRA